uniref:Uncharacterized protein n=1 Tax=Rhizophora mucronata TaxID=61149 RepID=A0A2P2PV87_RHIMU
MFHPFQPIGFTNTFYLSLISHREAYMTK